MQWPRSLLVLLSVLPLFSAPLSAETWPARGYSFSDEFGGLSIRSVTGSGTIQDPVVIVEEILEQQPVTLVVREIETRDPTSREGAFLNLAVLVIAINRTNRVWAGFNLELREVFEQPSTYYDGLSFYQMTRLTDLFRSDRFAVVKRRAEPSDLVQYRSGSVDPGSRLRLWFQISDTSPVRTFFLIQEPEFLMARQATPGRSLAEAVGSREPVRRQAASLRAPALPGR